MIEIEQIEYDRLEELLLLMRERSLWLESIGLPMWNRAYLQKNIFMEKYNHPLCFLAKADGKTIGGFVLMDKDEGFWKDSDDTAVYYLHKLVVGLAHGRKGYGKMIVDEVINLARRQNKKYLRLEYYKDRKNLKSLYQAAGFQEKEVLVMPDGIAICKCERVL